MNELLIEWSKLDDDHKEFVLRVRSGNGDKRAAKPHTVDSKKRLPPPNDEWFESIPLWHKTEESGFIKCIGSYKWIVTPKFNKLEKLLFGVG